MLRIISPSDLSEEVTALHQSGLPGGYSTGWPCVDDFYTLAPGFWTVITGVPSHGKSTWLDNLMLNLIRQGWKFIVYSPENQPHALHVAHLIEKLTKRPFRRGYHNCLEPCDLAEAMGTLDESVKMLAFDGGAAFPSMNTIQFTAHEIISTCDGWDEGPIGLIVDPWNELDHTPVAGLNETQMINHELMIWRQWIRDHGTQVHGFIVAHPQKPGRDKKGNINPVGLYDINGSAAWYNKADMGVIVRRKEDEDVTEIEIEKCRFRHLGKKGIALLDFESGTGTYHGSQYRGGSYRSFDKPGDDF
jgi:twinkle protein